MIRCSKRLVLVSYLCEEDEGCREVAFPVFSVSIIFIGILVDCSCFLPSGTAWFSCSVFPHAVLLAYGMRSSEVDDVHFSFCHISCNGLCIFRGKCWPLVMLCCSHASVYALLSTAQVFKYVIPWEVEPDLAWGHC